jgi:nitrogen regulatory protein PII
MSLTTYPKKRIEIVIEAPAIKRLLEVLDQAGVTGYTVVPALAGRGQDGPWRRDDSLNNAGNMVMVICITDGAKADDVLSRAFELVRRYIGIVSVSDIQVVRKEHF